MDVESDGDARVDVVEAQGEVEGHEEERVYFGTDALPPDRAAPILRAAIARGTLVARVHDNRSSFLAADWKSITATWSGGRQPMTWYGENHFYLRLPHGVRRVEVCATDMAGNETCVRPDNHAH